MSNIDEQKEPLLELGDKITVSVRTSRFLGLKKRVEVTEDIELRALIGMGVERWADQHNHHIGTSYQYSAMLDDKDLLT